jgi:hypothetical protein
MEPDQIVKFSVHCVQYSFLVEKYECRIAFKVKMHVGCVTFELLTAHSFYFSPMSPFWKVWIISASIFRPEASADHHQRQKDSAGFRRETNPRLGGLGAAPRNQNLPPRVHENSFRKKRKSLGRNRSCGNPTTWWRFQFAKKVFFFLWSNKKRKWKNEIEYTRLLRSR